MTLNDLECPIHLKVRLMDGTLDVRLLRVSDSTICVYRCSQKGRRWAGSPSLSPCGQLTRCFSAVGELFVRRKRCMKTLFSLAATSVSSALEVIFIMRCAT